MTNCPHCPALVPDEKLADHVRNKHPEKLRATAIPPHLIRPGAQGESGLPPCSQPPGEFRPSPDIPAHPGFPVRPQPGKFKCDLCQRPFDTQQGRGRHRAACVKKTPGGRFPITDDHDVSADSLRRKASELRSQAAKLIDEASRCDKAANILEGPK